MPAIEVDPESLAESPTGGPVIGGVTFRRPTSRSTTFEPVRNTVTLAGGDTRTYDVGRRRVVSLSWSKLTDDEVAALVAATRPPFITYADDGDTPAFEVSTDEGISSDAVAGTYPIRHAATLTLRGRRALPE